MYEYSSATYSFRSLLCILDKFGRTALMLGIEAKELDFVRQLVDKGANVNATGMKIFQMLNFQMLTIHFR